MPRETNRRVCARQKRLAWASVSLLALLLTLCASASASNRAEAQRHYKRGQAAMKARRYLEAIRAFEAAGKLVRHPLNDYALARACHEQYSVNKDIALLRRAVAYYQRFVTARPSSRYAADARAWMFQALASLASSQPTTPPRTRLPDSPFELETQLLIQSRTPGARVTIDGKPRGGAPAPLLRTVKPGPHKVVVSAAGYLTRRERAVAVKRRLITLGVDLEKILPATIRVDASDEGAYVYLDGQLIGRTPLERRDLALGKHHLAVRQRGRRLWQRSIELRRGVVESARAKLRWTTQRKLAVGIGATGLASVLAGAVTGLLALLEDGTIDDLLQRPSDPDFKTRFDASVAKRDGLALASTVTLVAGLAGVVAAGLMLWLDMPAAPRPTSLRAARGGGVVWSF